MRRTDTCAFIDFVPQAAPTGLPLPQGSAENHHGVWEWPQIEFTRRGTVVLYGLHIFFIDLQIIFIFCFCV